jgi:hypothetical protein
MADRVITANRKQIASENLAGSAVDVVQYPEKYAEYNGLTLSECSHKE